MMRTPYILLLCIMGAALLSTAACNNGRGPQSCCFQFYPRELNANLIVSYNWSDQRCPLRGVLFKTRRRRNICVNPEAKWVKDIIEALEKSSS
ncbi:C-C motif chemokine 4 homolog [Gouania willdenowi]|uniref:C-C motif chemokine n=1 Tax=Gouania willdenowi TaxID=441366 RepID=A0A8C5E705_GOUWI|nr:C-C motif chemokine 4 homolog [Gouania willdenowi]